jgi:fructokinase
MFRIGIDLGGTKIEGIVLDAAGREVARRRIATEAQNGSEHIIKRIAELYAGLVYAADDAPHTLGIGTPGALIPGSGLLKNSNTTCLNGLPLGDLLAAALKRRPAIANDANCFALAEAMHGAGRGHACVFGVILGTGCGGGIVIDGRVRAGPNALAGEWGHTVVDPAGPACYCGARGCVETFLSGGGLERRFEFATGRHMSAREIAKAKDDPQCVRAMDDYFAHFGRALANLIAVLDPDVIVLGGGLSNIDALTTRGVQAVRERVFGGTCTTPIVRHALGDSAGVIGAALIGV